MKNIRQPDPSEHIVQYRDKTSQMNPINQTGLFIHSPEWHLLNTSQHNRDYCLQLKQTRMLLIIQFTDHTAKIIVTEVKHAWIVLYHYMDILACQCCGFTPL